VVIRVVEFSSGGLKIRKIFALKSTYPKEISIVGKCQKVPGFDFQKSPEYFSFFSLKI
jgi:hypothetical protein